MRVHCHIQLPILQLGMVICPNAYRWAGVSAQLVLGMHLHHHGSEYHQVHYQIRGPCYLIHGWITYGRSGLIRIRQATTVTEGRMHYRECKDAKTVLYSAN